MKVTRQINSEHGIVILVDGNFWERLLFVMNSRMLIIFDDGKPTTKDLPLKARKDGT